MAWNDQLTKFFGRRFALQVEEETKVAREAFLTAPNHLDRDLPDKTYWVSVLIEEVGKLARACNKLAITYREQADQRTPWNSEGKRRLITLASVARRMAERWDEIPDQLSGDWRIGGNDA